SCFGFEDTPEGGDNDCNDVIFHVHIDPFDAVKPLINTPTPATQAMAVPSIAVGGWIY
ncbi:DUF4114 domain-containing protein, partial [Bacteroides sp. 214]|uniref:DUF4114 domain-containing protein n=1 Tax=Bacteroides sp. 214 TaxID=2302935 RepID=UPI0013D5C28C